MENTLTFFSNSQREERTFRAKAILGKDGLCLMCEVRLVFSWVKKYPSGVWKFLSRDQGKQNIWDNGMVLWMNLQNIGTHRKTRFKARILRQKVFRNKHYSIVCPNFIHAENSGNSLCHVLSAHTSTMGRGPLVNVRVANSPTYNHTSYLICPQNEYNLLPQYLIFK